MITLEKSKSSGAISYQGDGDLAGIGTGGQMATETESLKPERLCERLSSTRWTVTDSALWNYSPPARSTGSRIRFRRANGW